MTAIDGVTLALDAATYHGSVAVLRGTVLLAEREVAMRGEREERLMPAVAEALAEAGASAGDIARVVCGAGPGSFTSLRIAAAIAKGIAAARGVALFELPSLALLIAGSALPPGRYLAVLDAMRDEAYVHGYERTATGLREIAPFALIPREAVAARAQALGARAVGPGEGEPHWPHARGAAMLTGWLDAATPVDLAGWEPRYGRLAEAQVKWEREHGRPLAGA